MPINVNLTYRANLANPLTWAQGDANFKMLADNDIFLNGRADNNAQSAQAAAQAAAQASQAAQSANTNANGRQPGNLKLTAIASSVWAANQIMFVTGANSVESRPASAFAVGLLDNANKSEFKNDLDLQNVDNTPDTDKPISGPAQLKFNEIDSKINEIDSKIVNLKIAVIGDSMSQSSVRNNEWGSQLCEIIQKYTGTKVQFRNVAINGATFNSAINEKEHENATKSQVEEVISFQPDLVFIALGANDAVYSSSFTQAEVIANAQSVFNSVRTNVPGVKIIYCEQALHDITLGLSPVSLTNKDCVPVSHTTITLNGKTGVRINNTAYLNTELSSAKLAAHQLWGNASTAIRAMSDGWFSANIWKMARMGGMLDFYHVDQISHTYWAWQAVAYLSTTSLTISKVNLKRLAIKNISTNVTTSLDAAYTEALALTPEGTAGSEYYGNNIYQRMTNWVLRSRYARLNCERIISSASQNMAYSIEKAWPDSEIWHSVGSTTFSNSGRKTQKNGSFLQNLHPATNTALSSFLIAGTYTFYVGIVNPDGSCDVISESIQVLNNYLPIGATSLRYLTASAGPISPNAGATYINWTGADHDDLGVGSTGTSFIIPASLNGRKIRIRANIRVAVPMTSADTSNCWINAAIWKNRVTPPGNNVAAGRGLPSQNMILTSSSVSSPSFDLSLSGAAITVATGDYFEVVMALSKVSLDPAYVSPHSVTWFEIELVG